MAVGSISEKAPYAHIHLDSQRQTETNAQHTAVVYPTQKPKER